jgi:hypothetical protein
MKGSCIGDHQIYQQEFFMTLLPWSVPLIIAAIISWLVYIAYKRMDDDRPHDITEDYMKVWDDEVGGYVWRKKQKPETDRERLERQNNDI